MLFFHLLHNFSTIQLDGKKVKVVDDGDENSENQFQNKIDVDK